MAYTYAEVYNDIANAKEKDQHVTREEYFDIKEKVQKLTDDSGESGVPINLLNDIIQQTNITFKKVRRTNEAKLDAEIMKTVVTLGKNMIQKTQPSFMTFKPVDFADKILSFIEADGPDCLCSEAWLRLGTRTESFYKHTQGLIPLHGALEWKKPERAPRVNQERSQEDAVVVRKVAEQGDEPENSDHDTEDVNRVYNALKVAYKSNGKTPILLFRFIINPNCFSTTIHNLLHLSFLIRDGYAKTYHITDNEVVVVPVSKNKRDAQPETEKTFQAITDFDFETIEEAKKILNIRQPMIPVSSSSNKRSHS